MTTSLLTTRTLALALLVANISTPHASATVTANLNTVEDDPRLFLEEIQGERALQWVGQQNQKTKDHFQQRKDFAELEKTALSLLQDSDRLPYGELRNALVYNLWQDKDHVRGLWRRATLASYQTDHPVWETLIDLDALSKEENENWVFKKATCLQPEGTPCLVEISRGGQDAVEIREFDIDSKKFVKNGFRLTEAKTDVAWLNGNQIIVGTNFGEGSTTDSGYPRLVKLWSRGRALKEAQLILEGNKEDVVAYALKFEHPAHKNLILAVRQETFYEASYRLIDGENSWPLQLPRDLEIKGFHQGELVGVLKSDWAEASALQGDLVSLKLEDLKNQIPHVTTIYRPKTGTTLNEVMISKRHLLLNVLENVQGVVYQLRKTRSGWDSQQLTLPLNGAISIQSFDQLSGEALVEYENFLVPSSLYYLNPKNQISVARSLGPKFNADNLVVSQKWTSSRDGTKIPYFLVHKKDLQLNGKNPTLLYGYGGFEISMTPYYSPILGALWLERGGVYVLANIRGGGEFGPAWHQAALKENRQRAYDDFFAVALDLIAQGITSPQHLGAQGGSNGGLLMGVALTQRPDLFNAIVCQVPLLDMARFHLLLAGASWMGEYGNPDIPEELEFILKYSPYHNLRADAHYPTPLFMTSTKDDRVHPGHARKMAKLMEDMGLQMNYYENVEGGHGGSSTLEQRAYWYALMYSYLNESLF